MRARLAGMPHVTSLFMPLGKPAYALADKGSVGKARRMLRASCPSPGLPHSSVGMA